VKPGASALFRRKGHLIHKGPNDQDAPATGLQKIFGFRGIGEFFKVKALALVLNDDFDTFAVKGNCEAGFLVGSN
jgi:hypothetical protein